MLRHVPACVRKAVCYTYYAMEKNTKDILEAVIFIKDRMATKDDLAELRKEVAELRTEFVEFRTETRENFAELRAAAGLRRKPSGHTIGFHEIHDEGNRHFEMGRGSVPRPTQIDKTGNTFTQIERIGFRHGKSPPCGSESRNLSHRNPFDST